MRSDGRRNDELRKMKFTTNFVSSSPGAVLVEVGKVKVLCTASVDEAVPKFLENKGRGWLTAEYAMLPGSTVQRKQRDRSGKVDGRSAEIQRLIGRSLRSVMDFELLGERTIWVDCDVLEADGGTRTAAITASFVAIHCAVKSMLAERRIRLNPLKDQIAAVSVGIVAGEPMLDLAYEEDSRADADMNVVMTKSGKIVEIQCAAEKAPFSEAEFAAMMALAKKGLAGIYEAQAAILS